MDRSARASTKSGIRSVGLLIVLLVLGSPLATSAQERRPLTLEDYYRLESVGAPAIAPDGHSIAYVRTRILEEENRRHSEIWLAAFDGSAPPVRLTSPAFSASNPQWSPDGALLAFASNRPAAGDDSESRNSIWFLRMDRPAGEAFRIEGVGGPPIFSPDNERIAFTQAVPPEPATPPDTRSGFERRIEERFDGRIYDWMSYRFDRRGYLGDPRDPRATPPRELYVVARNGGTAKQLTQLGVNVEGVAWRPDGRALAFTADTHQRDEYTYERADLWIVDMSGRVKRLTDDGYHYSSPAWSPDGQTLVVRGYRGLDEVIAARQDRGSPIDLFLIPASGGQPLNLTDAWDLMPGEPVWSRDGRLIYFNADIGGTRHLLGLAAADGTVRPVTEGRRRIGDVSFSADLQRMAFVASEPTRPDEIHTARIDGSSERRLTSPNDQLLGEIALSSPERLEYASEDGTPIEGWLLPPNPFDPEDSHPLVLVIHGGPHAAYGEVFSFYQQLLATQGYFVLYTNPRGSTGYGEDFKWATWGGWGVLDYRDIMAGVDYVLEHYPVDRERLGVTGASYGGFMTNWVIGHTDRFAAAVARASISNWVSDYGVADIPRTKESEFFGPPWEKESRDLMIELSPLTHAGNVTTPTLFLHGELDHRVPIEEAEQMYVALKKRRVPAKFIRYPESYHGGWTPWRQVHAYYQELKWWEHYLGASQSTH
jgi:dipeptidyl aminopeptidase/acylaminoacyl peptidase